MVDYRDEFGVFRDDFDGIPDDALWPQREAAGKTPYEMRQSVLCPQCGYDLRSHVERREPVLHCPECGGVFSLRALLRARVSPPISVGQIIKNLLAAPIVGAFTFLAGSLLAVALLANVVGYAAFLPGLSVGFLASMAACALLSHRMVLQAVARFHRADLSPVSRRDMNFIAALFVVSLVEAVISVAYVFVGVSFMRS